MNANDLELRMIDYGVTPLDSEYECDVFYKGNRIAVIHKFDGVFRPGVVNDEGNRFISTYTWLECFNTLSKAKSAIVKHIIKNKKGTQEHGKT